jgi:hypothetical protein
MRPGSDVNLLTVIIFALATCAIVSLQTTFGIAERLYEVGLKFLGQVLSLF